MQNLLPLNYFHNTPANITLWYILMLNVFHT